MIFVFNPFYIYIFVLIALDTKTLKINYNYDFTSHTFYKSIVLSGDLEREKSFCGTKYDYI